MPDDRNGGGDGRDDPSPFASEHTQRQVGDLVFDALDAMDEGPDAVEALHGRVFGADVAEAFERATLAQLTDGEPNATAPAEPTRLESFVRLSFKQARALTSVEEDEQLAVLEAELTDTGEDEPEES
jgi:hypothetical protein